MTTNKTRREFLRKGAVATAGFVAVGAAEAAASAEQHEKHEQDANTQHQHEHTAKSVPAGDAKDRGKLVSVRRTGLPPVPVETPDIPKLPWKMVDGVKEFHLTAEHLKREFLPDVWIDVWGYNGSMPGPTIEAVEGDKVRIVVHNKLPESTVMHWHGLEVPIAMDGVPGVTQDPIPAGGTYTYEFTLRQNGTFFYHSHGAMQEGMGMVGLFIIHPKSAWTPSVDRDIALVIQEWAILPGATIPNTMSMEFNIFTINGRAAPYITPLAIKQGERVRIRLVNFSPIDHHPMHLHGITFWITGTEAGRIPETAWIPSNNVLVGVAQARDIEFVADNPGDWVMHCHMFHHMMNFMSSMVGPMAGQTIKGMKAGRDMATSMGMLGQSPTPALSEEYGPALGRGTGEQTTSERAVANGMQMDAGKGQEGGHAGHGGAAKKVPGSPQDMFGMIEYSESALKKLSKPETRGMRKDWYKGVEALMTVVRVLPPDLYEKVVSGKGEVPVGASVPGSGPGKKHEEHEHKH
jgi:FtsP/CotA-like multicopper oxidase with cupredoxin domain